LTFVYPEFNIMSKLLTYDVNFNQLYKIELPNMHPGSSRGCPLDIGWQVYRKPDHRP